jgi:hypothetical protein
VSGWIAARCHQLSHSRSYLAHPVQKGWSHLDRVASGLAEVAGNTGFVDNAA